MMENCFRNVQNMRKNVYDIIISPIYHKAINNASHDSLRNPERHLLQNPVSGSRSSRIHDPFPRLQQDSTLCQHDGLIDCLLIMGGRAYNTYHDLQRNTQRDAEYLLGYHVTHCMPSSPWYQSPPIQYPISDLRSSRIHDPFPWIQQDWALCRHDGGSKGDQGSQKWHERDQRPWIISTHVFAFHLSITIYLSMKIYAIFSLESSCWVKTLLKKDQRIVDGNRW